jgi:hypothetical protein
MSCLRMDQALKLVSMISPRASGFDVGRAFGRIDRTKFDHESPQLSSDGFMIPNVADNSSDGRITTRLVRHGYTQDSFQHTNDAYHKTPQHNKTIITTSTTSPP